jgi:hypothetical protein
MAIDHRADEGLIAEAAFELFGRLFRGRNWQRSEAGYRVGCLAIASASASLASHVSVTASAAL